MATYHVVVQEVRTIIYAVEAPTLDAAREQFIHFDSGRKISDVTTDGEISDIVLVGASNKEGRKS